MGNFDVIQGDCLSVMRGMDDDSIDSIVTDPPYGLSKEPDAAEVLRHWLAGDDYSHSSKGFMGRSWDSFVPGPSIWREALRVLKPGGHMLVFSGSRTYDLTVMAIRLAGFEIRDQVQWIYGSGFPKSLDVSKAIDKEAGATREIVGERKKLQSYGCEVNEIYGDGPDKGGIQLITAPATEAACQWQGWGTALKPAHEPICLARKPLISTIAENVQQHGTGALNVDGCRVGTSKDVPASPRKEQDRIYGKYGAQTGTESGHDPNIGRWPANVIHDGSDEVEAAFAVFGEKKAGVAVERNKKGDKRGGYDGGWKGGGDDVSFGDTGTASRFFYCSKASKKERWKHIVCSCLTQVISPDSHAYDLKLYDLKHCPLCGDSFKVTAHPTQKPETLMRYLCRLITPPGGLILDPFAGTGSTGKGALLEGFRFVGIELEQEYAEIARLRIKATGEEDGTSSGHGLRNY